MAWLPRAPRRLRDADEKRLGDRAPARAPSCRAGLGDDVEELLLVRGVIPPMGLLLGDGPMRGEAMLLTGIGAGDGVLRRGSGSDTGDMPLRGRGASAAVADPVRGRGDMADGRD
jgi:hypothetical protein